jgi:hypothetical protein
MENITRDVILDLWPLYVSGEASPDSRGLVETFLKQDPGFAAELRQLERPLPDCAPPSLPPDHDLKTFDRLKRRLRGPIWLLQLAILFTCFAFGRIVADTSFDVSPRQFIITAAIAACFWIAFLVKLFRGRRAVLVRLR